MRTPIVSLLAAALVFTLSAPLALAGGNVASVLPKNSLFYVRVSTYEPNPFGHEVEKMINNVLSNYHSQWKLYDESLTRANLTLLAQAPSKYDSKKLVNFLGFSAKEDDYNRFVNQLPHSLFPLYGSVADYYGNDGGSYFLMVFPDQGFGLMADDKRTIAAYASDPYQDSIVDNPEYLKATDNFNNPYVLENGFIDVFFDFKEMLKRPEYSSLLLPGLEYGTADVFQNTTGVNGTFNFMFDDASAKLLTKATYPANDSMLYHSLNPQGMVFFDEASNLKVILENLLKLWNRDAVKASDLKNNKDLFKTDFGLDFDADVMPLLGGESAFIVSQDSDSGSWNYSVVADVTGQSTKARDVLKKLQAHYLDTSITATMVDQYLVVTTMSDPKELFVKGGMMNDDDFAKNAPVPFTTTGLMPNEFAYVNLDRLLASWGSGGANSLHHLFMSTDFSNTGIGGSFQLVMDLPKPECGEMPNYNIMDLYTPKEDGIAVDYSYADVKEGDWFYDTVKKISSQELMVGYDNPGSTKWLFKPDQPISRAEFVKLLMAALSYKKNYYGDIGPQKYFTDVTECDWFAPFVNKAYTFDFVSGFPDGSFRPGQPVTRAEAVKMLVNTSWKVKGFVPDKALSFQDVQPTDWFYQPVAAAVNYGLAGGKTATVFDPNGQLTRAEAAKMMENFVSKTSVY